MDEANLQSHLDSDPGDGLARLLLADLLEEQGRDDEARFQRWLAEHKLWPDNDLAFYGGTGWQWWESVDGYEDKRHAMLPSGVLGLMPDEWWNYRTRVEAEAVLCKALGM